MGPAAAVPDGVVGSDDMRDHDLVGTIRRRVARAKERDPHARVAHHLAFDRG
jgi:hypothetical protein